MCVPPFRLISQSPLPVGVNVSVNCGFFLYVSPMKNWLISWRQS